MRTCPGPGGPGSGTSATVSRSRPPTPVRTAARTRWGASGLRQERRRQHLLVGRHRDRDRRPPARRLYVDLQATPPALGIDEQRQEIARRGYAEPEDREIGARERSHLS